MGGNVEEYFYAKQEKEEFDKRRAKKPLIEIREDDNKIEVTATQDKHVTKFKGTKGTLDLFKMFEKLEFRVKRIRVEETP